MSSPARESSMDPHEILSALTTSGSEECKDFDGKLKNILEKVLPNLPETCGQYTRDENGQKCFDIRMQYLGAIVFALHEAQSQSIAENEELINVSQYRIVKAAIELIVSIGIVPCLLRGVGVGMAKLCPRALQISQKNISDLEKYEMLSFSTNSLLDLYKDVFFRPAILARLGPLLASLLQLSHAPLMKPSTESTDNAVKDQFVMTTELYEKLNKDQESFSSKLEWLQDNCPGSLVVKELMVILGIKESPNWLKREAKKYLIRQLIEPTGVTALIGAVCDDTLDIGEHWDKLDTVSRLIATSHGNHPDYYKSVCQQILELLASKRIKHSSTIANCCIVALYEFNPEVCTRNIFETICSPLLPRPNQSSIKSEHEVELCVESLTKCFITVEAKFKQLPSSLLSRVALPLFSLHNYIRQSACALKGKVKQLNLKLLYNETLRNHLIPELLGHKLTGKFGPFVVPRFGPNGGVEVTGIDEQLKYEEYAESFFDLASNVEVLSTNLFDYLLNHLSDSMRSARAKNLLETEEDAMERIEKQLSAVKLLSNLANTSMVQESQLKRPEHLITFIKSLFDQFIKRSSTEDDDDCEVLYISLMLVKMILSESKGSIDWEPFNDFVKFLKGYYKVPHVPSQLLALVKELVDLIEKRGGSGDARYQDLSVDRKASNKFEEAIKDLQDPLLPVRGHGLITLTKLIETMDPCAIAQKPIILRLFQENLKHEDSFIYLAAINGMCALATSYPQVVIETLVQEFIDMPQRISGGDINAETRLKLGEILVKTTRALGEMAVVYKNTLVNGFLCATKDPDPMVRASSLSCLGELCKVLGFRLGDILTEVIYCISCIVKTDKAPECRRAAVLVSTLLLRGLGKDTLTSLGSDLVDLYRGLKYLRDNDDDPVLRLHAQLALEELDQTVKDFLFAPPKLEKRIFLLESSS